LRPPALYSCMNESLLTQMEVAVNWAHRHTWTPGSVLNFHHASAPALWVLLSGSLEVAFAPSETGEAGETPSPLIVPPGHFALLPGDIPRTLIASPDGADWLTLGFNARAFGRIELLPLLKPPFVWLPADDERERLVTLLTVATQEWLVRDDATDQLIPTHHTRDAYSSHIADGIAKAILSVLWRYHGTETLPGSDMPPWLQQTLTRMAKNPGLHLPELIKEAKVSEAQFRRGFRRWLNQAPQAYLTERRLDEARRLLTATDLTVTAIAERLGFESVSHFTRLFARRHQHPPARYRQQSAHPPV
jgi:AraC-like DNA-binding protein